MKIYFITLAALIFLIPSEVFAQAAFEGDGCRLYKVEQIGPYQNLGSYQYFIGGDSLLVFRTKGPSDYPAPSTPPQPPAPTLPDGHALEILLLWANAGRPSGNFPGVGVSYRVDCVWANDFAARVSNKLDSFTNSEVRKLASEQIEKSIKDFVTALQAANEQERKHIIDEAVSEITKSPDIINALSEAMKKK